MDEFIKHERAYKKLKKMHKNQFRKAIHGYPARGPEEFRIDNLYPTTMRSYNNSSSRMIGSQNPSALTMVHENVEPHQAKGVFGKRNHSINVQ